MQDRRREPQTDVVTSQYYSVKPQMKIQCEGPLVSDFHLISGYFCCQVLTHLDVQEQIFRHFSPAFLRGDSWTLLDHFLCLGVSGIWGWGNWATLRVSAVMQMLGIVVSCCHTPYGCFLKWWYPRNTPKWLFLVGKPMVVGYHHFRKPPYRNIIKRWCVFSWTMVGI